MKIHSLLFALSLVGAPLFGAYTYTLQRDLNGAAWSTDFATSGVSQQTLSGNTGAGYSGPSYSNCLYSGYMTYTAGSGNFVSAVIHGSAANQTIYLNSTTNAPITGYSYAIHYASYWWGAGITITANAWDGVSPTWAPVFVETQLASGSTSYSDGAVLKAFINNGKVVALVNNTLVASANTVWTPGGSMPGVCTDLNASDGTLTSIVTHIDIGSAESVPPNALSSGSITKSISTNYVNLAWPAATDDANGLGVLDYQVYRNGLLLGSTTGLTFSDTTVTPGTNYSYQLVVRDFFFNTASTTFSVMTTPIGTLPPYPSSTPDGRRVGVRTTGAYWGASGEKIDVRSGNLNFSMPLLSVKSRAGLSVGFSLSYNSQNWRYDSSTNWKFDGDVGFGFGWRLQAGSLMPVWNAGLTAVNYYFFIDSTGAEYKLDQSTGNVWSSKESIYVWFDANTSTLYFRDGSSWYFGCVSAGGQADQGVMYPTSIQDVYGNAITITYNSTSGAGWTNSSSRISAIYDVRSALNSGSPAYTLSYGTDLHLTSISNAFSWTPQTASFGSSVTLISPFDGSSQGTTKFLSSISTPSGNVSFTTNSSGEITRITLPGGGYLGYDYATTTYPSGKKYREVSNRYLSKDGSTQTTYQFIHETSVSAETHSQTYLCDPGGVGQKFWALSTSGTYNGLATQYQGRHRTASTCTVSTAATIKTNNDFTWSLDTASANSYISSTLTTLDPASANVQSKVNQTVDNYGNVTQVQSFNYGSLSTPARTTTYAYLAASTTYTAPYMYNDLPPVIRTKTVR
jgi:hypothetical protein